MIEIQLIKIYEKKLDSLRKKNDATLDLIETTKLRGRIYEIKELLKLLWDEKPTNITALTGTGD